MTTHTPHQHHSVALHRLAVFLVIVTFFLLILGGTVTSKGVGLSVPDWPTSYGQNMFLFPPSMWKGGVFWEHTHRLLGALVGMVMIVMAAWLWGSQKHRPWLRWLGIATLVMVIVQGVMGGLRVTEMSVVLGIAHGISAQIFLCMTVLIAAATSRLWINATTTDTPSKTNRPASFSPGLKRLSLGVLAVMLIQLTLGATVRHTGSRLAIPDFPSAYGRLIPPMTAKSLEAAGNELPYEKADRHYTPSQVGVHFSHRLWAIVVLAASVWLVTKLSLEAPGDPRLAVPLTALTGLLLLQITLGALVIWTGGHAPNDEFATAHQATGAAILATATLLAIRIHVLKPIHPPTPHPTPAGTPLKGAPA